VLGKAEAEESARRVVLEKEATQRGPLVHPAHPTFGVASRPSSNAGYVVDRRVNGVAVADGKVPQVGTVVHAPTSVGNKLVTADPIITRHVSRDHVGADGVTRRAQWTVVARREYAADLSASNGLYNVLTFGTNPADPTTPWQASIANEFEQYSYDNWEAELKTAANTGVSGRHGLALDYVVSDAPPATKTVLYGTNGAAAAAPWENVSIRMRRDPTDYLNTYFIGPVPAGADPKFYSAANLFVFNQGISGTALVSEIWVSYETWMLEATLENLGGPLPALHLVVPTPTSGGTGGDSWQIASGSSPVYGVSGTVNSFIITLPNVTASYLMTGHIALESAAQAGAMQLTAANYNNTGTMRFHPVTSPTQTNSAFTEAVTRCNKATTPTSSLTLGVYQPLSASDATVSTSGISSLFTARLDVSAGQAVNTSQNSGFTFSCVTVLTSVNTAVPAWVYVIRLPASLSSGLINATRPTKAPTIASATMKPADEKAPVPAAGSAGALAAAVKPPQPTPPSTFQSLTGKWQFVENPKLEHLVGGEPLSPTPRRSRSAAPPLK